MKLFNLTFSIDVSHLPHDAKQSGDPENVYIFYHILSFHEKKTSAN